MNLADMLVYADIAELAQIAEAYGCTCSSHSKNELIQSILATLQRRDAMESRIDEMSGTDLRFLNSLLFENRSSYSLEELKARALDGSGAVRSPQAAKEPVRIAAAAPKKGKGRRAANAAPPEPEDVARKAIARFRRFGWLFNGATQQSRYLFQVPQDVKASLCDTLERRYRQSLVTVGEPPAFRDERGVILDDLVRFLRYVRNNDVPLTVDGAMYKRQLQQILEAMAIGEPLPERGAWRFGYGRHFREYPDRFSLMYDFARDCGYVAELPDRLALAADGAVVAAGEKRPDALELYKFWQRAYKIPVPNAGALAQWLVRLSGEWVTLESLKTVLLPLVRPFYYDTSVDVLEKRVLKMALHLGLVRIGATGEGETVVKATPQGKQLASGQPLR